MPENLADARLRMINGQLRTSDVNARELLAAFLAVPRGDYVAPEARALAYTDGEVAALNGGRLLSPRSQGLLLKAAAPVKGERTLSVGSAYGAALLSELGLDVATQGPFDLIVLHGAFEAEPLAVLGALMEGGRLVGLRARGRLRRIVVLEKLGGAVSERELNDATGDVLPGFERAQAFAF